MRTNLLNATSALALLAASPVAAQTATATSPAVVASSDTSDIVVTGSRIKRPTNEGDQPTVTVTGDTIDARGFTSVGAALNQQPGFGIADSSSIGSQGNGFGVGQSFVNLYSLGSQRTLTLVNGRRFVGANPASVFSSAEGGTQVDLNTIPTALIERVDVVGIGGAPIYGADAIAGTINIILKKNFTGLAVDAQQGISQLGDLENHRIRAAGGFSFGPDHRGNLTASIDYNSARGIIGTDRTAIAAQIGFISPTDANSKFQQVLVSNLRTFLGEPGGNPYVIDQGALGAPGSVVDAAGNLLRFAPNGNLVPFNTGTATNDPTTYLGGDALNQATTTNLAVNYERINTNLFLNYRLTDHINAYAEGWYSKNKAVNLAGQPIYNTGFFSQSAPGSFDVNGNFDFNINNPFLTPQARGIIQANLVAASAASVAAGNGPLQQTTFYLGRANTDLVSGVAKLDQDLYRFVGGFNGDFPLFGHTWSWDVSGNYGRTRSVSITPSIVEPNLRRALNVTTDANGNIVCAPFNPDQTDPTSPPIPRTNPLTPPFDQPYAGTISQTCAPLNLFGQGAPSQAARDYVTTNARTVAITSQRDFVANLTGAVAKLPGGDLGVSIGYENRREYSSFEPDGYYTIPLGRSIPILGLAGSYVTNELYGETRLPLIGPDQHIPLVHAFEVNGAVRYVRNSLAGSAVTYTAGGRYSPFVGLSIRGNFTRSIRAPAVTELFAANQPAFDGGAGTDPCDRQNLTAGPNPAVRAKNCAAAGLPTVFTSGINSFTVPITVIGNRALKNETAKSFTVGALVQPKFIPRLTISADYISIDLKDAVASLSAKQVLDACYDSSAYPTDPFCALFKRDPTTANFGQVLTVQEPYFNQGTRVFRGVQAAVDYTLPLPRNLGSLTLGANYLHIIKQYTETTTTSGPTQTRGGIGSSIDQADFRATVDTGNISFFNEVRFIGPALFDPTLPIGASDTPGVGSYIVWNTNVAIKIGKQAVFQINVDNVTNRGLPYPGNGNGSQNVYSEGLFGRTFLVGVKTHF